MIKTFFDFCSGIGAGRLGLEQCGLVCVGHSDTSRLADTTYKILHNADNEINHGNLKRLKGEKLPNYDLLIAGFPCQTFSVIGRQEGFKDDRGQIIFHLARLLRESKPKCFILENVKGLVTHDDGKTLKIIINELNSCGYITSYRVIASLDCGVPQMRQRVYFIGFRKDLHLDVSKFRWPTPLPMPLLEEFLIDEDNYPSEIDLDYFMKYLINPINVNHRYSLNEFLKEDYLILDTRMNDMRIYRGKVPTLRAQRDGIYYVKRHELRYLSGYEALLLQGFPKEYADKVKNKVSNRHLLMQAGNAMTVNVIAALGNSIINFFKANEEENSMSNWENFEIECVDYLNHEFGSYAKFIHQGGSDSTVPDIFVETLNGKSFYIEAKCCPAQCGQFVLLPDIKTQSFIYSKLNANPINNYAQLIMQHMNARFDEYREAGTSGKEIEMRNGSDVFSDWIIKIYQDKGARFFITNNYVVLPIERFKEYFYVTAKYRIKRSGSSNVGKRRFNIIKSYITSADYIINDVSETGDKLYVSSPQDLHNKRFIIDDAEYMFSLRDDKYEIRKLSNTYNANVIFSIKNKVTDGLNDREFIAALR